MNRDLDSLSKTVFDVVVIGGGIHGAAVAREAALRGLKAALVEASDFASGTSSRSSKLIHGGLRYLPQYDFKLVREARRERRLLLELAPHLVRPLPFLLPIYRGDPYSSLEIRLGLTIYDFFGNIGRKDRHQMLRPAEALRAVPKLRAQGLRAAAVYHDSETDDARLTLENVLDAAEHGALVANYAEVVGFAMSSGSAGAEGAVVSAEANDRLTGRRHEISGRFWINAAGPWVDYVRALLPGYDGSKTVRLTKGTHIILPQVSGSYALFAAILPGKRIFLLAPWHGYALLGTTDTDFESDPASVRPDRADAEYLLGAVNRILQEPVRMSQVTGSFSGLRALVIEPGRIASANTREYRFHSDRGARNFVTICGGKLTTARALAEKIVDQLAARLGPTTPQGRSSRTLPLPGGFTGPFEAFAKSATEQAAREFRLSPLVARRIIRTYGSRWRRVLEPVHEQKNLSEPLPGRPTLLAAEVDFAIRHEMALNVDDFLLRRSGLNWLASSTMRAAVPAVAQIFADRFAWSSERRDAAINAFGRLAGVPLA